MSQKHDRERFNILEQTTINQNFEDTASDGTEGLKNILLESGVKKLPAMHQRRVELVKFLLRNYVERRTWKQQTQLFHWEVSRQGGPQAKP